MKYLNRKRVEKREEMVQTFLIFRKRENTEQMKT